MSLGFGNVPEVGTTGSYLRSAGTQVGGKFKALTYVFTEAWEGFDIEMETADGKMFRERTFGADPEKVYPRAKYEKGVQVGMETKAEAFDRVQTEISTKIFQLASSFVPAETLRDACNTARDLKELVDKTNKLLSGTDTTIPVNFVTMWKNSDSKQKSNLIIADKVKWVEASKVNTDGTIAPANVRLSAYQQKNNTVEKYPYQGANSTVTSDAAVANAAPDDLPF